MTSGDDTGADSPARRRVLRLIIGMCVAHAASMLGFASFPALQPTFTAAWDLSSTEAGWINGIYFGAYMAAVPVLVSLTDRVDPRRIYVVGSAAMVLSSIAFALFAGGFWSVFVIRVLAGAGLAGTYMPGLKALTDQLPAERRSRAVAFYTATFSIGSALSFLLTGEIAAVLDWRWAVGLAALGPAAAALIVLLQVPPGRAHQVTPPATALLDFRPVLRNRRAFAYILGYCGHTWELFTLRSWIVTFFVFSQSLQGEGAWGTLWSATMIAAAINVLGLPASVLGNEAAERYGRRRVVIAIMVVSALIAACLGFLAPLPFVFVVAVAVVYGITVTGESASLTAGAVANAAPGQTGATMAVHSFIGFAGGFAGPVVFGVVLDLAGGPDSLVAWGLAFLSSGLAVATGPLALITLGGRRT